jgi:hypothetical protein
MSHNSTETLSRQRETLGNFNIQSVAYGPHQISLVSMEGVIPCFAGDTALYPPDRMERVAEVMNEADLTTVPYFMPEIEKTVYAVPVLGAYARRWSNTPEYSMAHYADIANLAHERGERIAVADIANRLSYGYYALNPVNLIAEIIMAGNHELTPSTRERYFATTIDARRMFTAEALKQEANRSPDGVHLAYIGAPAHVSRIKEYISRPLSRLDKWRLALYIESFSDMDSQLRIYEPAEGSWRLSARRDKISRPVGVQALLRARA